MNQRCRIHTIENQHLKVVISQVGAEVKSVVDKLTGKELWWTGDAAYWDGSSPILFPACGGLWNGEYTYEGNTYKMPKHGFVSSMQWFPVPDPSDEAISFGLHSTDETLRMFPFHFELGIRYEINGKTLACYYRLRNLESNKMMSYQIGGHPAIQLPDFEDGAEIIGYIQPLSGLTHVDAHCLTVVRAGEQGCWSRHRYGVPSTEAGLIPISVETFANEALIFDHKQITGANILDSTGYRLATVTSHSPVWLFWQQQNQLCPFICAEPWYGLCDKQGESTTLIERPYTQSLAPQAETSLPLWKVVF